MRARGVWWLQDGGGARGRAGHQIDPVFLALSKLRKRQFDACIEICTNLLAENPLDQVGKGRGG